MRWMLSMSAVLVVTACASSGDAPEQIEKTSGAPATFQEQVALGGKAYVANCASCHGSSGEGVTAPRVVGLAQGALPLDPPPDRKHRTMRFETVADVAGFVVKAMPPPNPGGLDAETYWAILAFDLHANGIDLDQKLTPELAAKLTIPR